jgi:hypothetical protein
VWFLALFSFVLSVVLVGLSVFPGVLEQVPSDLRAIGGGAYGLLAFGLGSWRLLGPNRTGRPRRRGSALVVLLCVVVTPLLLLTHTPRRILFGQHRGEFEKLLEQAPQPGNRAVVPLNADLSVYWIDHWGTDARGGTYFRTVSGRADGRPDRRSFGFAYRPNPDGSPFGDARYELAHLTGDWYSFSAADDR